MSNIITPLSPNTINQNPVDVWRYPEMQESNPAVQAAQEYKQNQYINYLATPDTELPAIETSSPMPAPEAHAIVPGQVSEFEAIPPADQLSAYSTNTGETIDPQHTEAVLTATAKEFASAAGNRAPRPSQNLSPQGFEQNRPVAANEVMPSPQEIQQNHNAAVKQAGMYAEHINSMRNRALVEWGAEGEPLNQ